MAEAWIADNPVWVYERARQVSELARILLRNRVERL